MPGGVINRIHEVPLLRNVTLKMAGQDTSNKKLFIRGLPSGTTNGDLEDVFTEYGPVKSCFTVKEKGLHAV